MQMGTCTSCGSVEEVVTVRRVYVTPEAWDSEYKATPASEVETWCYACRAHYPHQDAAGETPAE